MIDQPTRGQYKASFYIAVVTSVVGTIFLAYMLIVNGLPESSEAKIAYTKFIIALVFFYFGCFLMRYKYKNME